MRAAILAVLVALASPAAARATTYYVSPTGSDAAAGTSPGAAWRSVDRVDHADLASGDRVLFAGGARFSGTLMPPASGTSYASFGAGRARIAARDGGVWLPPGTSRVTFSNLDLSSAGGPGSIFSASARGRGNADVTLEGSILHDGAGAGVMEGNAADRDWTIRGNTIRRVGDSGIIFLGTRVRVERNTIVDTGLSRRITWAKHGIYAKGPYATLTGNRIERYETDGISLRYRAATVVGNTIGAGTIAIAWFQQDHAAATTRIEGNVLTGSRASSVYVSPTDSAGSTRESFSIRDNAIQTAAGNAFDIQRTKGSVTITGNRVDGNHSVSLSLVRPAGRLVESGNTWSRAAFLFGKQWFASLDGYRGATGLGAGDTVG